MAREGCHIEGAGVKTFVGRIAPGNFQENETPEFTFIGDNVFESEELIDKVYRAFVLLITKGWVGDNSFAPNIEDISYAYRGGFYLPCTPRVVLSGAVDLNNDEIPLHCGHVQEHGDTTCISVLRIKKVPRGWAAPTKGVPLRLTYLYRRKGDRALFSDQVNVYSAIVIVKDTGEIVPCLQHGMQVNGKFAHLDARICWDAAIAINAAQDARFVWNVKTSEPLVSRYKTPLILGCSEEHIKSLFYAREAPLTETGRKRPILHWVSSHQRRIKSGIDIDISKHMRGVFEFEMEGFHFTITNPRKGK